MRINLNRTFINQLCYSSLDKDHSDDCVRNDCLEFAFVRFYDVVESQDLRIDKIYEQINCLHLQWQRCSGESNVLNSAKVFGLVPIDRMRSLVHIVRSNEMSGHHSPQNERRKLNEPYPRLIKAGPHILFTLIITP